MRASNYSVHVIGNDEDQLIACLGLVMLEQTVVGWRIEGGWLVLSWYINQETWSADKQGEYTPTPYKFYLEDVITMVKNWLREQVPATDPPEPYDGSIRSNGWELEAVSETYEVLRVRKVHALYHK